MTVIVLLINYPTAQLQCFIGMMIPMIHCFHRTCLGPISFVPYQRSGLFCNFHKIFKNFDSSITHFGDIIHTLETGEEIIASEYHKKILKISSS